MRPSKRCHLDADELKVQRAAEDAEDAADAAADAAAAALVETLALEAQGARQPALPIPSLTCLIQHLSRPLLLKSGQRFCLGDSIA
jgi:hypothetical protein